MPRRLHHRRHGQQQRPAHGVGPSGHRVRLWELGEHPLLHGEKHRHGRACSQEKHHASDMMRRRVRLPASVTALGRRRGHRLRNRVTPELEDAPPPPDPAAVVRVVLEPFEDDVPLPRGRDHRADDAEEHAEELECAVFPSGRHALRAQRHREEEGEDWDAGLQRAGHHRGGKTEALEEQELVDEDPGDGEHEQRAPRRRSHHDWLPSPR
mmetsp:Transcript_4386/g.16513  ORF Transcript_4386/g.16513 Transcript_4386/m.16513 type:complete len:210 (-) Transcript_4386:345-974(-)